MPSYSEFAVRWARRRESAGAENFRDDVTRSAEQTAEFRTHLTRGVNPKMRVLSPGAVTTLSASVTGTGVTSLSLNDADGFPLEGQYRIRVSDELMNVTAGQGTTTWTVERAADGTSASTYATGQLVQHMEAWDVEQPFNDWEFGAETVMTCRRIDGGS